MKITDLPQMVAAFHSLVGLAAVTTSVANYMGHNPALAMDSVHLVATYLGTWIGAVTLTGARWSALLPMRSGNELVSARAQQLCLMVCWAEACGLGWVHGQPNSDEAAHASSSWQHGHW